MLCSDLIYLNVGGYTFVCTRTTLANRGGNFFASLIERHPDVGEFFIDRDPSHFRYILNYLRGHVVLPFDEQVLDELAHEADYFCLDDLARMISDRRRSAPAAEAVVLRKMEKHLNEIARSH